MNVIAQMVPPETVDTRPYRSIHYSGIPTLVRSFADPIRWASKVTGPEPDLFETTVLRALSVRPVHAPTEMVHEREQPQEPSAEDKLHAKLLSYLELSYGWDGRDAVPPSLESVLDAFSFLAMRPVDMPFPFPQIASDGEVGLYWHTGQIHAEIGFYGDGDLSYYARYTPTEGEFEECGRDDYGLDTGCWPQDLMLILNKLEP